MPDPDALRRIEALQAEIAKLWTSAAALPEVDGRLSRRLDALELGADERATASALDDLRRRVDALEGTTVDARARELLAMSGWVANLAPQPLTVSVVMATHNRADLVQRAIASVERQSHTRWQLIVVDDASEDTTPEVLHALDDPRIVVTRVEARNQAVALNHGLTLVTGDAVAYLDDDNVMHRDWLQAVAWAFLEHPGVEVVYGARIREREVDEDGMLPVLQYEPWDRRRLERENFIDQNVLAHRPGLPEVQFDAVRQFGQDWDLALRLTRTREPLALPVVAVNYAASAPGRLSRADAATDAYLAIAREAFHARPLRVLALHDAFPLATSGAIIDLLAALDADGAVVESCSLQPSPAAVPAPHAVHRTLPGAIAAFAPDVVLSDRAGPLRAVFETLEREGLPFALRLGPGDVAAAADLSEHPQCAGTWVVEADPAAVPDGATCLPPLIAADPPPPAAERDLVLVLGAADPGYDWLLVFEALSRLGDAERRVVVGALPEHWDFPTHLMRLATRLADPPLVQLNAVRGDVAALLARSAAVIVPPRPGARIGAPMAAVEALWAGTSLLLPAADDAVAAGGPAHRSYTSATDVVAHVTEVLAGGPDVEAERAANRRHHADTFGDRAAVGALHRALREACDGHRTRLTLS